MSCRAQSCRGRNHPESPGEPQAVRVREATPSSLWGTVSGRAPTAAWRKHPSSEHPLSAGVLLCLAGLLCTQLGMICNPRTDLMLMSSPHTSSICLSNSVVGIPCLWLRCFQSTHPGASLRQRCQVREQRDETELRTLQDPSSVQTFLQHTGDWTQPTSGQIPGRIDDMDKWPG